MVRSKNLYWSLRTHTQICNSSSPIYLWQPYLHILTPVFLHVLLDIHLGCQTDNVFRLSHACDRIPVELMYCPDPGCLGLVERVDSNIDLWKQLTASKSNTCSNCILFSEQARQTFANPSHFSLNSDALSGFILWHLLQCHISVAKFISSRCDMEKENTSPKNSITPYFWPYHTVDCISSWSKLVFPHINSLFWPYHMVDCI